MFLKKKVKQEVVSNEEVLNDLKLTLGNLWYALDDEWGSHGSPFDASCISLIAEKYGWTEKDILDAVGPIC